MLAPPVANAPDVGTSAVTVTAKRGVDADARHVSYIDDTHRENVSPSHHPASVGYTSDTPKTTLDNRRSAPRLDGLGKDRGRCRVSTETRRSAPSPIGIWGHLFWDSAGGGTAR
jgi:hypothetical protein